MDKQLKRLIKIVLLFIFSIMTYQILSFTFIYLYPFIIAFIFSLILHPVVTTLERILKVNRFLTTLLVMLGFALLIGSILFGLSKWLLTESKTIIDHVPYYIHFINDNTHTFLQTLVLPLYEKTQAIVPVLPDLNINQLHDHFQSFFQHISFTSTHFFEQIIYFLTTLLSSLTYIGTIFIIILIATFILTIDMNRFTTIVYKFIPRKILLKYKQFLKTVKTTSFDFLKAQIILASCSTIIIFTFFLLWKIENALIMSLIIFFIDLLPYLGIGLLFIPWIIFLFLTGNYMLTVKLSILYVIVIIIRQFIEPKIIASSMGLHPLVSLIILFLTFKLWGLFGIILTPFILIGLSALYQSRILHHVWVFINN